MNNRMDIGVDIRRSTRVTYKGDEGVIRADPNGGRIIRRSSGKPEVHIVVGSTGFSYQRHITTGNSAIRKTVLNNVTQGISKLIIQLRRKHLNAGMFVFVEDFSAVIGNFGNAHCRDTSTVVADGLVRACHIH